MPADLHPALVENSPTQLLEQSGGRLAPAPAAGDGLPAPGLPDASARAGRRGPDERPGPEAGERRRRRRLRAVAREAEAAAHRAASTERLFRVGLHHLR
jgi:hypothetical protein